MITKESKKGQTQEEWQAFRQSLRTIGGSDAGTLLGLNKYASPYSLWAEKTGKITPPDISEKEAVRLGNDLEDYVAKRWAEKTGKTVRRTNFVYRNSDYPYAHANVDRLVVGENAGLECKTTSSYDVVRQCQEGSYPDTWYAQMMHYMMVTGAQKWYLGVLCFGRGFFTFEITRDDSEIAALAAAESNFYSYVIKDTPPQLDGTEATSDALKTILGDSYDGENIDLMAVSNEIVSYHEITAKIKELTNIADGYKNRIMSFMGSAEKGSSGDYTITFKTQSRTTFDRDAFERARGPIPAEFFRKSTSRPFRLTVKKQKGV